jgi:hypothetical protein
MATVTATLIGARAKGAFGPQGTYTLTNDAFKALQGDAFIAPAAQSLIGGCGDERLDVYGQRLLLPSAFGGWFSAVLADALTVRQWYQPGMSVFDHAEAMAVAVRKQLPKVKLCVHTDTYSVSSPECGCAAIAKAPVVLELLLQYPDLIAPAAHDQAVKQTRQLLKGRYFQAGTARLVDQLEKLGITKEVLDGSHGGVAYVRNRQKSTIYNRPAFYAWCKKQSLPVGWLFEYDEWSMQETARQLTTSSEASQFFFAGADAFNSAVPYAIFNTRMPMLVRQ